MSVRWHLEDEEWLGWLPEQDMREDAPTFSVRQPEPGIWAGWLIQEDGSQNCITMDHHLASRARTEVETAVEIERLPR